MGKLIYTILIGVSLISCGGREYGEMQKGWTAEDAKGYIKVLSTPLRVYYNRHEDELL